NVTRYTDVGLHFFYEAPRRRAANRFARQNTIALGFEGRRMTHHDQRAQVVNLLVPAAQRRVDFVFGKFSRSVEGREVRTTTSEYADSVDHPSLTVKIDSFALQKRHYFTPIKVARKRENLRARPAHV